MYPTINMHIAGAAISAADRASEPVIDPATEEVLGHVPHAMIDDLDRALASVDRGFGAWSGTAPLARAQILRRAGDVLRTRADDYARVLTAEQGKPLAEAKGEVMTCADVLDWYAEEGRRVYGRTVPGRNPAVRHIVVREPIGPALGLTPWNFPMFMAAHKVGGALAAGCSLILKPSEETPASAMLLVEALYEAGLPADALALVFGVPAQVSSHLIASDIIRKISFTGSVAVGRHLMALSADGLKRTTMELGGHAPVIVCDDVDVAAIARQASAAKFRNAGQVCVSPTRFFVHHAVHDQFLEEFTKAASAIRVGPGSDPQSQMGPLANPRRVQAMERLVADARQRGAQVATGGERVGNQGFFFAPTILHDIGEDAQIMQEEPFGPIATVSPFADLSEAIERANETPYGLAGYAFAQSSTTLAELGNSVRVGMLGLNTFSISTVETPFGGIKYSGHGREGGNEGLDGYLDTRLLTQA
jgi:succinate-semialdehyde dehydrogenase/glutarate-semialdehyde dehydrogenase